MRISQIFMSLCAGLVVSSPAFASVMGNEGSGGGAGCLDSSGHPQTLYYCGAYHPYPVPMTRPSQPVSIDRPSEVPSEVLELESLVAHFDYLSPAVRQVLLGAIKPSYTRKYFAVPLPPPEAATVVNRMKNEFQSVTGIDSSRLELYAITDTSAHMSNYSDPIQVTYLLPAFAALPSKEQKLVALFHESLWVLVPTADYATIIKTEMAFEATLAQPGNTDRLLAFVDDIEQLALRSGLEETDGIASLISPEILALKFKSDLQSGALRGFVAADNSMTNLQLFGLANLKCAAEEQTLAARAVAVGAQGKDDSEALSNQYAKNLECETNFKNYLEQRARFRARVPNDLNKIK